MTKDELEHWQREVETIRNTPPEQLTQEALLALLRLVHQFSLRRPTEEYQGIMTMIFSGDAHVCFGIHLVGGQFEIKAELIKPDGQTEPLLDLHGGQDGPLAVH